MPVFETIRVIRGRAPFLEWHLERLQSGARALDLAAPGSGVRDMVIDVVSGLEDGVLRVQWDGSEVGVTTRAGTRWGKVRMSIADEPHRGYAHKTTGREWLDRALAAAVRDGDDETLFVTETGYVAEGALSAVGFVRREVVMFPPLDLAILPSIGRRRVLDLAHELGLRVRERRATLHDLRGHPAFVVNAVRGVGRVVSLGGESLPGTGLVGMLERAFWPSG